MLPPVLEVSGRFPPQSVSLYYNVIRFGKRRGVAVRLRQMSASEQPNPRPSQGRWAVRKSGFPSRQWDER